jgi:hypothetical protein
VLGLRYPKDISINPASPEVKRHPYFSSEYVCDHPGVGQIGVPCRMNYAILIWGQRGIYIHEWPGAATYIGNGGPLHVEVGDAKKIYDWLDTKTRIVITYPW